MVECANFKRNKLCQFHLTVVNYFKDIHNVTYMPFQM